MLFDGVCVDLWSIAIVQLRSVGVWSQIFLASRGRRLAVIVCDGA